MPDINKTWYTIPNQSVSAGTNADYKAAMMYQLKDALTGGISARTPTDVLTTLGSLAGTVVQSSDATSTGASDLIVDASALTWDNAGSNHSWFVIEFTDFYASGQHQYMLVDCRSTNEGIAYISFSRNAYTGGTLTDAPTATDEVVIKDGSTPSGNMVTSDCWDGADTVPTDGVLHVQVSADGECYRWFLCRGGTLHTFAGFQRAQRTPTSGMTNDAVFWWMSLDSDSNVFTFTLQRSVEPFYVLDNSNIVRTGTTLNVVYGSLDTSITTQTANAHDNTRYLPEIALWFTTPLGVQSVLIDVWWASGSDAVGTKAPSSNEVYAQIGDAMIPWPLNRVFTSS